MDLKWLINRTFLLVLISIVGIAILIIISYFGMNVFFNREQTFMLTIFLFYSSFIYEYKMKRNADMKMFFLEELHSYSISIVLIVALIIFMKILILSSINIKVDSMTLFMVFLFMITEIKFIKIIRYLVKN